MRSSKSRSRNKSNRNRSVGNIVNRVFDSSGPEGKVRGTPQQIIDKYNQLARDAQLSNDRVAAENFQQHAEHYLRMLAEAQREMQERQQQNQQRRQDEQQQPNASEDGDNQSRGQGKRDQRADNDAKPAETGDVVEASAEDAGLVETPEERPQRQRRSRSKKPEAPAAVDMGSEPQPEIVANDPPKDAAE